MDGYFYSEHNFSMISYCWKPHLEYHKSAGTSKEFIERVTKLPVQGVNLNDSSFKLVASKDSMEISKRL